MRLGFIFPVLLALPASAEVDKAQSFGDWSVTCVQDACEMSSQGEGAKLAFTMPKGNDSMLLLAPDTMPREGEVVMVTIAGNPGASLGPGDGWRLIGHDEEQVVQLSPSVTANEFEPRFPSAESVEFGYIGVDGTEQRIVVPLTGYGDARSWVEDNS